MPDVHRGTPPTGLIAWHSSVGVTLWAIILLRLIVRINSHVPPAPTDIPQGLRLLARVTHNLFYAGILVLPVLGYLNASARGWEVWPFFGLLKMPQLVPAGTRWAMKLGDVHVTLATVLLGVVGLHVAGALYHGVVLKDGTTHRISPA